MWHGTIYMNNAQKHWSNNFMKYFRLQRFAKFVLTGSHISKDRWFNHRILKSYGSLILQEQLMRENKSWIDVEMRYTDFWHVCFIWNHFYPFVLEQGLKHVAWWPKKAFCAARNAFWDYSDNWHFSYLVDSPMFKSPGPASDQALCKLA